MTTANFGQVTRPGTQYGGYGGNSLVGMSFVAPADVDKAVSISFWCANFNANRFFKGIIALWSDRTIISNGITNPSPTMPAVLPPLSATTALFAVKPTLIPGTKYVLAAVISGDFTFTFYVGNSPVGDSIPASGESYVAPASPIPAFAGNLRWGIFCTYDIAAAKPKGGNAIKLKGSGLI